MDFIIAGAYYYDEDNDIVLVPHFTREFHTCDCTQYLPLNELKERYNEDWIKENKNNFVILNDKKYYYAEFAPYETDGLGLISDLSNLTYEEDCSVFEY